MAGILTALLLLLTLPPFEYSIFAYIAFLPYFIYSISKSSRYAVIDAGVIGFFIGTYVYFGSLFESPILYIACIVIVVVTFTALGWMTAKVKKLDGQWSWLKIGVIWTSAEIILNKIGLPFAFTVSLVNHIEIIQIASIIGSPGTTLLLVSLQAKLAKEINSECVSIQFNHISRQLILFVSLIAAWVMSGYYLEQYQTQNSVMDVVAVQTSLEPETLDLVGLPGSIELVTHEIRMLINEINRNTEKKDLVIWPESIIPGLPIRIPNDIVHEIQSLKRQQIIHAYDLDKKGATVSAGWQIDADGEIVRSQFKQSPVLFVEEYKVPENVAMPVEIDGRRVGVLICSDSVFTKHYFELYKNGADFVAVVTNDAYAGPSILSHMHLALDQVRAVESGLGVVRSANGGPSAIISPSGRVSEMLENYQSGLVAGNVKKVEHGTLYYIMFPYLSLVYLVSFAILIYQVLIKKPKLPYKKSLGSVPIYSVLITTVLLSVILITMQYIKVKSQYEKSEIVKPTHPTVKKNVSVTEFIARDMGLLKKSLALHDVSEWDALHELENLGVGVLNSTPSVGVKHKHVYGIASTGRGDIVLLQDDGNKALIYAEETGKLYRTSTKTLARQIDTSVTWVGVSVKKSDK